MPIRPASRAFTLEVDHVLPGMTMAPRKLGGSGRACQPDGRPAAARVRVLGDAERPVPCALGTHDATWRSAQNGYARASYASGGGGASRMPRIAGEVAADSALVSCVLVSYAPCAERRRFLSARARLAAGDCLMGVQLGFMGVQLGGKVIWAGLRGCASGAGNW
jgi:hypothetical protein